MQFHLAVQKAHLQMVLGVGMRAIPLPTQFGQFHGQCVPVLPSCVDGSVYLTFIEWWYLVLAAGLLGLPGPATTAHGGRRLRGRRTGGRLNVRTALVRLLRDLQHRLEGLALLRLHRLLHVGQPLVALASLLSLHFV